MATDIKVPAVGESITEGTVSRWLKKDGETVRVDEPVLELETEKATTDVAAPATGTLRIGASEGATVAIGAVVGRIEEGTTGAANGTKTGDGKPAAASTPPLHPKPSEGPILSPSARRLAEESGIDARQVSGSGPGGRITKEDLLAHIERQKTAPANEIKPAPPAPVVKAEPVHQGRETRNRMSSIRHRIAERLVAAQHSAAMLTTFNEADMSAVITLRTQYKDAFQKKHGVGLGFMSFFVRAAVAALQARPIANAFIDGKDVVFHHYYNIGVAVSTEKGLLVPVLRDADQLSFAEIEKRIAELAHKARDGKINVEDLQGGTFTITNGGIFGSLLSTPILNPPQSAILGMHSIQKRPIVVDDQIAIRPMMYLALSYDHRLIDGRDAVLFLVHIKECIEHPERLLLEI